MPTHQRALLAPVLHRIACRDDRLERRSVEIAALDPHALTVGPVQLACRFIDLELLGREGAAFLHDGRHARPVAFTSHDVAVAVRRAAHVRPEYLPGAMIDCDPVIYTARSRAVLRRVIDQRYRLAARRIEQEHLRLAEIPEPWRRRAACALGRFGCAMRTTREHRAASQAGDNTPSAVHLSSQPLDATVAPASTTALHTRPVSALQHACPCCRTHASGRHSLSCHRDSPCARSAPPYDTPPPACPVPRPSSP